MFCLTSAPLGYDRHPDTTRRELVVNESEAEIVRQIFTLYLDRGCLNATARAANALGIRSKHRVFASGRVQGGTALSRGQIHKTLTNPVYRGLIKHKTTCWPGTHDAIIEEALWDSVQTRLQAASAKRRGSVGITSSGVSGTTAAPLLGKVRDETGELLTPTHTQRHGRRLRYYVSNRLLTGTSDTSGWRLPAPAFEQAIAQAITDHLDKQAHGHRILADVKGPSAKDVAARMMSLVASIKHRGASAVSPLIASAIIAPGTVRITLDGSSLATSLDLNETELDPDILDLDTCFTTRRRGAELRIVAGDRSPAPDPTLIRAFRNAHRWAGMLTSGIALKEIARREQVSHSYVGRVIPLSTLSPRIQDAIVTGSQPLELSLETLVRSRLPLAWEDQETRLGFAGQTGP